jgi:hypothetical protein
LLASCRAEHPLGVDGSVGPDGAGSGITDAMVAIDAGAVDAPSIDAPPEVFDPDDLRATGLCADAACTAPAPGVVAFEPRWQLWSDGAAKRRWIQLPPGTKIDTSNIDYWQFPIGTKLWKEFTVNGARVETRYMTRTGPRIADWRFLGYQWNPAQTRALAAPDGATDVNGTSHDIPSQRTCRGCHSHNSTPVLGVSAFQLDHSAPSGAMDLDDLNAAGLLTVPPPGAASPHFPLPGTATDKAALGYAHVNCGHCHNSDSQLTSHPMLRIESSHVDTMANTRLYQSTVGVTAVTPFEGASVLAAPGAPDRSVIIKRTTTVDVPRRMPALGIETVDPAGQQVLRAWILALP